MIVYWNYWITKLGKSDVSFKYKHNKFHKKKNIIHKWNNEINLINPILVKISEITLSCIIKFNYSIINIS